MRTTSGIVLAMLLAGLSAPGQARVGVTSETNGDPTGKPPTQDERVLRVGIDIQANEVITTREDDRAHLMFLDGTSLTVGPNARLIVDRFVYDPASRTGDLAVTVSKGVFRLVGGKISKTTPIVITTPSSTIGIRGGIGLFSVDGQRTTSQFLFGVSMSVSAQGQTETASRPGSQITTASGGRPSIPSLIGQGGLAQTFRSLEGRPSQGGSNSGSAGADQQARQSGFSDQNSGKGPSGLQTPAYLNTEGMAQTINSAVTSQSGQQVIANRSTLPLIPSSTPTSSTTGSGGTGSSGSSGGANCYDNTRHDRHRHNNYRSR